MVIIVIIEKDPQRFAAKQLKQPALPADHPSRYNGFADGWLQLPARFPLLGKARDYEEPHVHDSARLRSVCACRIRAAKQFEFWRAAGGDRSGRVEGCIQPACFQPTCDES